MPKRSNELLYQDIYADEPVAILGGSFNPIHKGHLLMAETAHEQLGTDIIIMPNKATYYKESHKNISDENRIDMIKLAIEDKDYLYYSDMEIKRGGITHTIDTIRELQKNKLDRIVYFIIGGDSLEWVDKWVEADELLRRVHFLSAVRGDMDIQKSQAIIDRIKKEHPDSNISLMNMEECPISSSDIRDDIKNGRDIKGRVPESVENYIINNKLYK